MPRIKKKIVRRRKNKDTTTITLTIPKKLRERMTKFAKTHPVNWSVLAAYTFSKEIDYVTKGGKTTKYERNSK